MKISSILILALATGTLGAQALPQLDSRFQVFVERGVMNDLVLAEAGSQLKDKPGQQTGVGIRFMGELASAPNFYYELGGTVGAATTFSFNGTVPNTSETLDMSGVKFRDSYWSLGVAYLVKPNDAVSLGLHLEARGERLQISGQAVENGTAVPLGQSTTYLRPWLRPSLDYTFTGIGAKAHPYIGLDGSFALMKTYQTMVPNFTSFDDRSLKTIAPQYDFAAYGGVRF